MKRILPILFTIIATAAFGQESALLSDLAKQLGTGKDTVWSLTLGNQLDSGAWLDATTDAIPADRLANDIGATIGRATKTVDIVTLAPLPEKGLFADQIRAGIRQLVRDNKNVVVRILLGNERKNTATRPFLKELSTIVKGSNVNVFMAAVATCVPPNCSDKFVLSTNHAKIVAIDGTEAIVGGHNLWADDYANPRPIYDLSMHVRGPAAQAATNFVAPLWKYACSHSWHNGIDRTYADMLVGATGKIEEGACAYFDPKPIPTGSGTIPILGVGRVGAGLMPVSSPYTQEFQWSDRAMQYLFDNAKHTIRLSQQDLFSRIGNANPKVMESLVKAVVRGVDVYVIVTNDGAESDKGTPYYEGPAPLGTASLFRNEVAAYLKKDKSEVNGLVCNRLHLAGLHRLENGKPANSWSTGKKLGNHAKMYIVDDHVFYIGSHNLYPMTLFAGWSGFQVTNQEYGYIVDDANATRVLLDDYWDPLWKAAEPRAVSGDLTKCQLLKP